jgi:hypothetical protein
MLVALTAEHKKSRNYRLPTLSSDDVYQGPQIHDSTRFAQRANRIGNTALRSFGVLQALKYRPVMMNFLPHCKGTIP